MDNTKYLELAKKDCNKAKTIFGIERRKMKALEIMAETLISIDKRLGTRNSIARLKI